MIDLTYLTEMEQEMILSVLKRDANLKKSEEQRVKNLQKQVHDKSKLKYLTGEWFYETKSRRHRDRIHGSDIIRASISGKKPVTILELSQMWSERPSFVNSENQDVYVPPELSGLLEETPEKSKHYYREDGDNLPKESQDMLKRVLPSSSKQRQNPFNSTQLSSATLDETEGQLTNGGIDPTKTPDRDQHEQCHAQSLNPQVSNLHSAQQESGKPILLGAGTQGLSPTKTKEEDAQSLAKIRDWFSWGRSDMPQAQLQPIDEPESPVNIITDEIPSDAASEKPSNLLSLKAQRRLLGIFSRWEARKEKSPAVLCSVDEDLIPSEQIKVDDALLNIGFSQSTVNTSSDQQQYQHECVVDEQSSNSEDIPDAREVKQGMDQIPQEAENSAYGEEILPDKYFWKSDPTTLLGKLSSDSTQCEVPVSREVDIAKNATLSCPDIQHDFDVSAMTKFKNFGTMSNDRLEPAMLVTHTVFQKVETSQNCNADLCATLSHDETSASSVEGNRMFKIPDVDGPFRAGSVLISEHHSSSSVGLAVASQAVQPEEKATIPLPVSPSSHSYGQRGGIQVSLVSRSLSPQPSMKAKINNLKSFWEKENTGPRVIVCKPKKALNSETHGCSESSPIHQSVATSQSELRPTETDLVDYDKQSTSSYVVKTRTSGFSMDEKIGKGSAKACLNTSLRSHCNVRDVDYVILQDPSKIDILKGRPSSPETCLHRSELPKWKDITDDELKRGPSTTHPTDLHKDSSGFEGVGCDSSPLKTFLTDKVSPTREPRNEPERSTPVVRQRKGLSHEVKQLSKFSKHTLGITSSTTQIKPEKKRLVCPNMPRRGSAQSSLYSMRPSQSPTKSIPHPVRRVSLGNLHVQEDCQQSSGSDHWHPHVKRASEAIKRVPAERKLPGQSKDSEMYPYPARSFIPQSNQHYLGLPVHQRTHIHQFISEKADPQHITPSGNTAFPLSTRNSKGSPCLISPRSTEKCVDGSSRRSMPEIWSQSWASSSCHEEDLSLIRVEKKQMTSRPLSRSMEDILSPPKREDNKTDQEGAIIKTVNDVPEQMKMISKSVSSLQYEKDGRDSDSTSVNSLIFGWKKRTGSSLTNLSVSSGMASMSSVSSSVASIYSGLERDVDVKGTIQFAINYVQKLGEFQIFVVHCRDLAVAEPKKNRSDPYVKCYLLPDKAKMGKRKTSVKKKTLNPTYNEILRFKVTMETLKTQNLNVSVWHNDNFGRNSFLGKVDLDLSEWDFSNTQMNDYTLKERMTTQSVSPSPFRTIDHRGEMKIALRFLPQVSHGKRSTKTETGEVQIWVKDCKNLPAVRDMVIDPFVKCTVLPETSRKSRQKTRVVKKTVNPMFNHTMVYGGFLPDDLRDACVEVTVWDHDRTTNHFLGGLRLGLGTGKCYESVTDWMDSTAEEAGLWERMMQSHNEWVEDILPLRMLIMGKGLSK
ncbi:synaptotagmin-like protein 2 isoform X2 [Esox lucius]|uniref:synaptotagmin-like protein 2 isoform X2 n=1 Tax=Esox lucius TaxID=8010 RepID=UPI001476F048|nr:synaptotagmin-like protein 2 isoform X2 [Esox lucius]